MYFWDKHLSGHFEEEALFFEQSNDAMVARAYQEHHQIQTSIASLHTKSQRDLPPSLEEIALLVDDHIRFEERKLFPVLQQTIPDAVLARLNDAIHQMQPEPLEDTYTDAFWQEIP